MSKIAKLIICLILPALLPGVAAVEESQTPVNEKEKMNGILIDCSRLLERHEYYFRLVDFMAEWEMNTLLLHFSDDHGCAIRLPGFEKMAMPNAFSAEEIHHLVKHAQAKGITIIPEVETFGHTRFITDQKEYSHLKADKNTKGLKYNALDPLNPETLLLVERLIAATAQLFPSPYLHIGCDEVNIEKYCAKRNLDPKNVWADYVNKVAAITRKYGKESMLWEDFIRDNPMVMGLLDKGMIPVYWYYHADSPKGVDRYKIAGFKDTILSPSICCSKYRVKPSWTGLKNTTLLAKECREHDLAGMINTIWMPSRYLQSNMYYGIAFSSYAFSKGGQIDWSEFHRDFTTKVFGAEMDNDLDGWLRQWNKLELPSSLFLGASRGAYWVVHSQKLVEEINTSAADLVSKSTRFEPKKNADIWQGMVLSAEVMWAFSEALLIKNGQAGKERQKSFPAKFRSLVEKVENEWDRTRFPDDPAKHTAKFNEWEDQYLLMMLTGMLKDFPPKK
ncbi:MAG: family 20 glycosylhydrolase [Thermoanaerobaculales bacterium]|nr:family 20 glycosylhydrolase [Thermoanaerobaculales bacterium]